jgi:hypothetical protein
MYSPNFSLENSVQTLTQSGEDRTVSRFHYPWQVMLDTLAGDAWHSNSEQTRVKVSRGTE